MRKPAPKLASVSAARALSGGSKASAYHAEAKRVYRAEGNAFFEAVYSAYVHHQPLELSPDAVWLAILQGFSLHVNENSEALRSRFVRHQGKKQVHVSTRPEYEHSPAAWEAMFRGFEDSLRADLGSPLTRAITDRFSTSTDLHASLFQTALLGAMQTYYEYHADVLCGIPWFRITGTPADWQRVVERTQALGEYDLRWWTDKLVPILREFERAAAGQPRLAFWRRIVTQSGEAGDCGLPDFVRGWVTTFFPYLKAGKAGEYMPNPLITKRTARRKSAARSRLRSSPARASSAPPGRKLPAPDPLLEEFIAHAAVAAKAMGSSMSVDAPPDGLQAFEIIVHDGEETLIYSIRSGFYGIARDRETGVLRPAMGWAAVRTAKKYRP